MKAMKKTNDNQWKKAFPEPPKHFQQRMEATLTSLPKEKEKIKMRVNKRFLVPVMALVAVLALGTGLVATGTISSIASGSPSKATYTEVPTAEQLQSELGFAPVVPEEFVNGYSFKDAVIGTEKGQDDQGNTLDKHKFLDVCYEKGSDEISYNVAEWSMPLEEGGKVAETYNGVDIIYTTYTDKTVPDDYEMTAADKAGVDDGTIIFSYDGSDETTVQRIQGVTWVVGNVHHNLCAADSPLTQSDLIAMAKEMID